MPGFKNLRKLFEGKKEESLEKKSTFRKWNHQKKRRLENYNRNESWFKSFEIDIEEQWNKTEDEACNSSSGRKIILPEEDIDHFDSDESGYESGSDETV